MRCRPPKVRFWFCQVPAPGKTKVLTTRLAYILANMKANPWNCLVVTFTNRAAREMKERVQKMIGDVANSVWLGTFHSICVKILRNHAELVGLHSNFTILDTDDQNASSNRFAKPWALTTKNTRLRQLLTVSSVGRTKA